MTNQDREEMLSLSQQLRSLTPGDCLSAFIEQAADLLERLARSPAPAVSAEPVVKVYVSCQTETCHGRFTSWCVNPAEIPHDSSLYLHPDPKVAELEAERDRWMEDSMRQARTIQRLSDAAEDRNIVDSNREKLHAEHVAKLKAENAALRKDAERYRWIFDNCEILVSGEPLESEQELDELIAKESGHD